MAKEKAACKSINDRFASGFYYGTIRTAKYAKTPQAGQFAKNLGRERRKTFGVAGLGRRFLRSGEKVGVHENVDLLLFLIALSV